MLQREHSEPFCPWNSRKSCNENIYIKCERLPLFSQYKNQDQKKINQEDDWNREYCKHEAAFK